ncbi:MAG: MBL fold metallo-hydrolase, partial [Variovorax sp.]
MLNRKDAPRAVLGALLALALPAFAPAASPTDLQRFNAPHEPFKIFGNAYYVGTDGLSSILVTSDFGHVLIDGGLPASAPQIVANIEKLGFKITDVKAILQSHAHPDHVGG